MIEAPLSIAFDVSGNPAPRRIERRGKQSRAWYLQGGLVTLVSAGMLLARLDQQSKRKIYLYEALLSFKKSRSDHADDATAMREAIVAGQKPISVAGLCDNPKDRIESSLKFAGIDFGIPPVFEINVQETPHEQAHTPVRV